MKITSIFRSRSYWAAAALVVAVSIVAAQQLAGERKEPVQGEASRRKPVLPVGQAISSDSRQAASVQEAARGRSHVERLSVMQKPRAFDAQAFARNPQSYLDIAEPGRVWDVAEPKEGVPALEPASPVIVEMAPLATTSLVVTARPNAPVTFTSFDLGRFANGLTTITVQADEKGQATAEFTASEGTIENVNVLAGSPTTSGQVLFSVQVVGPNVRR